MIGTAGTVNTGAIDDLQAVASLASEEDLWFHVDGCIGALIAIAPKNAYRVAEIEHADSVAPIHINGCTHRSSWLRADPGCLCASRYIRGHTGVSRDTSRGLASGKWLHDFGLQTSRGFRALKIWMAIKEHGIEKFGRLIDQNIAQGHYLTTLIEAEPILELVAPTNINIVCYRYRPYGITARR